MFEFFNLKFYSNEYFFFGFIFGVWMYVQYRLWSNDLLVRCACVLIGTLIESIAKLYAYIEQLFFIHWTYLHRTYRVRCALIYMHSSSSVIYNWYENIYNNIVSCEKRWLRVFFYVMKCGVRFSQMKARQLMIIRIYCRNFQKML